MADENSALTVEDLTQVFENAEKPSAMWRLGMEAEKFGLFKSGRPLRYEGDNGVEGLFSKLQKRGWLPKPEVEGGPLISLLQDGQSITLEPGAQVELSGSPLRSVHGVNAEFLSHLAELEEVSPPDLVWLHLGFHPTARLDALSWVPKRRYPIMRRYLPTKGPRGLDMMQRTATVQVNLDYESEQDALRKLRFLLKATPFIQAMMSNSPFLEGRISSRKAERADVWLNMDPTRSGLVEPLWGAGERSYQDYVQWALGAGMFFFQRGGRVIENTGQSFREFMSDGFEGHHARIEDWHGHLATLFPEVRLKSTIEVRCCDAVPPNLAPALPALLAGLVYDAHALSEAEKLLSELDYRTATELRTKLTKEGLSAQFSWAPGGKPVTIQEVALELLSLAELGLRNRGECNAGGEDESVFLRPLKDLVERKLSPGDELVREFEASGQDLGAFLTSRTLP